MCNQHIDPAEAVQIHKDIGAKYSLGIHWGTYDMGSTEVNIIPTFIAFVLDGWSYALNY